MHPLFAQPRRLLVYLAGWLGVGALLAGALEVIQRRPYSGALLFAAPLAVVYGGACLGAWWVCRSRPIEGRDPLPALVAQSVAALQTSAAWVALSIAWGLIFARYAGFVRDRETLIRDSAALFAFGVLAYALSAVVHYLFFAVEASHEAARRALESQVSAREAELRALRAQLNPHFLFNSLNSINALIGSDPEGARRMCEGLGDFLRRTLQLGARDSVTLGEELALADRYLAIEQVRFGARLQVERAVDPAALDCLMPPLLLQPLVENAVKHGVANRIEGGTLELAARVEAGHLHVTLENPLDEDAPARPGAGMGLEIVRRRLTVLGGPSASLLAEREPDRFRVTLTLPARVAEHEEAEAAHA